MNEEEIAYLREQGILYNNGDLTDLEGKFVNEYTDENVSYNSISTPEEFEMDKEKQEYLDSNFVSDAPKGSYVAEEEGDLFYAKKQLQDYQENPTYENLSKMNNGTPESSELFNNAFSSMKEDAVINGDRVYHTIGDFINGVADSAQYAQDDTQTAQNAFVYEDDPIDGEDNLDKDTPKIEGADPILAEIKFSGDDTEEQGGKTVGEKVAEYLEAQKTIKDIEKKGMSYKDEFALATEIAEKTSLPGVNAGVNFTADLLGYLGDKFIPEGEGIGDEETVRKYNEAKGIVKSIQKPIAADIRTDLRDEIVLLDKKIKELEIEDPTGDLDLLERDRRKLRQKEVWINDFIEENDFDWSILTHDRQSDLWSAGTFEAYELLRHDVAIANKVNNNEPLTPAEVYHLQTKQKLKRIDGLNFEQTYLHGVSDVVAESVVFMASTGVTNVAGKVVGKTTGMATAKYVTRAMERKLEGKMKDALVKKIAKYSGKLAEIGMRTPVNPATWKGTFKEMSGDIMVVENEDGGLDVLSEQRTYEYIKDEARSMLDHAQTKLENAKTEKERKDAQRSFERIKAYVESIKEPQTGARAFLHSGFNTYVENVSESMGGKIFDKTLGVAASAIYKGTGAQKLTNKIASKYLTSTITKSKDFINKVDLRLGNLHPVAGFNRVFGSEANPLLDSFTDEFKEEIIVQFAPDIFANQTMQEYAQKVSTLLDASFYADIAGSVGVMGMGGRAIGSIQQRAMLYAGLTAEEKKTKKEQRSSLLSSLRLMYRTTNSTENMDNILDKASATNGSKTMGEHNRVIANHEESGDVKAAARAKLDYAHEQVLAAQNLGFGSKFKKALTKALGNNNNKLDPRTREHMQLMLQEFNEMKGIENAINFRDILGLKSMHRYNKNNLTLVEESLSEVDDVSAVEEIGKALNARNKAIAKKEGKEHTDKEYSKEDIIKAEGTFSARKKWSDNAKKFMMGNSAKKTLEKSMSNLEEEIDRISTLKYQLELQDVEDYNNRVDKIDRKFFNGEMTVEQYEKYVEEKGKNSKSRKRISKDKLLEVDASIKSIITDRLKNKEKAIREGRASFKIKENEKEFLNAFAELESRGQQEAENSTEVANDETSSKKVNTSKKKGTKSQERKKKKARKKVKDTPKVVKKGNVEIVEAGEQTKMLFDVALDIAETAEMAEAEEEARRKKQAETSKEDTAPASGEQSPGSISDVEEGGDPLGNTQHISYSLKPEDEGNTKSNSLTSDKIKRVYDAYKTLGETLTFSDFLVLLVSKGIIKKEDITKGFVETAGVNWKTATGTESNWEDFWKKEMEKHETNVLEDVFGTGSITNIESEKIVEEQSQKNGEQGENSTGTTVDTGEVRKSTNQTGKTNVVGLKANYSAIVHYLKSAIEKGKTIITKESPRGKFNLKSPLNLVKLLNPNNNSEGTIWDVKVAQSTEDLETPVYEYNDKWELVEMTFREWIKLNKPSKMSMEEFMQTDAYIGKVPMFYMSQEGEKMSFVADTDWHNAMSVKDESISDELDEQGKAEIDLNNPSPHHAESISLGKKIALDFRKKAMEDINSGNTPQVLITEKKSSIWTFLPKDVPAKTLTEASPTSKIVFFSGDTFVDLENESIEEDIDIINKDITQTLDEDGNLAGTNSSYYLSPVGIKNGRLQFQAIPVLRTDENGKNGALSKDIKTARILTMAHNVLVFHASKKGSRMEGENMTHDMALKLQEDIKNKYGVDISRTHVVNDFINGLIAISLGTDGVNKSKSLAGNKNIPITELVNGKPKTKNTTFTNLLFEEGIEEFIVQNTGLGSSAIGIEITQKENGSLEVEDKVSYEDFLRQRFTTNVVSHNVGTKSEPIYTHELQPTFTLERVGAKGGSIHIQEQTQEKPKVTSKSSTIDSTTKFIMKNTESFLRKVGFLNKSMLGGDLMMRVLKKIPAIKKSLKLVEGINSRDQSALVDYTLALIVKNYENSLSLSTGDFYQKVKDAYIANHENKRETATNYINSLEKELVKYSKKGDTDGIKYLIQNLKEVKAAAELINENFDTMFEQAYLRASKENFIYSKSSSTVEIKREIEKHKKGERIKGSISTESGVEDNEEIKEEEQETYVKEFSKSSNEVIHKTKISSVLKRIFSSIKTGENGYMGNPLYEDYNKMYNYVATFLASPFPVDPDFDAMIDKLKTVQEGLPWLKELITELENMEEQEQAGFVTNMYKFNANAKFVMFEKNRKDGLQGEVWESNGNTLRRKIEETWDDNFTRGPLTTESTLDKEKLRKSVAEYESWGARPWEQEDDVLRTWLEDFGIVLSDGTWRELRQNGLIIPSTNKKNGVKHSFSKLFYGGTRRSGVEEKRGDRLFNNLYVYAKQHSNIKAEEDFTQNVKVKPLNDMSSIKKGLIKLESHYNETINNITRRDGDKTVSEIVYPSHILESVRKLKRDETWVNDLSNIPYQSQSYFLHMLKTNVAFKNIFTYAETGIMSIRQKYAQKPVFAKVEQLSSLDYMYQQRAMFQDMEIVERFKGAYKNVHMRVATMSTPTNSDKGRMMLIKAPVFDIIGSLNMVTFDTDGNMIFDNSLKGLLYDQLVIPEANRILETSGELDIQGYNKGARRFNTMPGLNTIVNSDGLTAIEYLNSPDGNIDDFKKQFFDSAMVYLNDTITEETNSNIKELGDVDKHGIENKSRDAINNKNYLARSGQTNTTSQNRRVAEVDYIVNSYIVNTNIMQTIAGDPALYYNSKEEVDSTSTSTETQNQISKDLGVNLGKRLALMIAPGTVGAGTTNVKHIQLTLKDTYKVAENAGNVIRLQYGEDALDKKPEGEKFKGETYGTILHKVTRGIYDVDSIQYKELKHTFSDVADYFNIETTDGQEYTTLREHLRILISQGKISTPKANKIWDKVFVSKERLDKNDPDVKLVLQPMKPVYTNTQIIDGVLRTVYIKSSSFPLIPDLVAGTKLEGLMNTMNEIEKKNPGKTVRASHISAVKVGATLDPIDYTKQDELDELTRHNGVPKRSLLLESRHLKIQQEVPYKSDKQYEDRVSMGTQIFKLLFGDGVGNIQGDGFDGPELKQKLFNSFKTIIKNKRASLLDELGLDENYNAISAKVTTEKVKELLIAEAEDRNFSENDMKSFGLSYSQSKGVYVFNSPLWLSGNSNKIESMLNAIITNSVLSHKLPGNSFVVGSNTNLELMDQDSFFESIGKSAEVKYQNVSQYTLDEFVASEKELRELAVSLTDRIGGKVVFQQIVAEETEHGFWAVKDVYGAPLFERFESGVKKKIPVTFSTEKLAKEWIVKNKSKYQPGYKGKMSFNGTYTINLDAATLDTPIHEIFAHPIIRALKNTKPELYAKFAEELKEGKGKEVLDRIRKDYKDDFIEEGNPFGESLSQNKEAELEDMVQEEAIVELLGLYTAGEIRGRENKNLISFLKELLDSVRKEIRDLLTSREINVSDLTEDITLHELSQLIAHSNAKFLLPGKEVIYTAPTGAEFKTYAEANRYISELTKISKTLLENVDYGVSEREIRDGVKKELKKVEKIYDEIDVLEKEKEVVKEELSSFIKSIFKEESYTDALKFVKDKKAEVTDIENKIEGLFKSINPTYLNSFTNKKELGKIEGKLDVKTKEKNKLLSFIKGKVKQIDDILYEEEKRLKDKAANKEEVTIKANSRIAGQFINPVIKGDLKIGTDIKVTFPEKGGVKYEVTNEFNSKEVYTTEHLYSFDTMVFLHIQDLEESSQEIKEIINSYKREEILLGRVNKEISHELKVDQKERRQLLDYANSKIFTPYLLANEKYQKIDRDIKEYKEVNGIEYNPEEAYSLGAEFVHAHSAYVQNETIPWLQNVLNVIKNKEDIDVSMDMSFTTSINGKTSGGLSDKSSFNIRVFPESSDIKSAFSHDSHTTSQSRGLKTFIKEFTNEKNETVGISFSKVPDSGTNARMISPNISHSILNHGDSYPEYVIGLKGNNWRVEYNDSADIKVKKLANTINSILDSKYGKLKVPKTVQEVRDGKDVNIVPPQMEQKDLKSPLHEIQDKNEGKKLTGEKDSKYDENKALSALAVANRIFPRGLITSEVKDIKEYEGYTNESTGSALQKIPSKPSNEVKSEGKRKGDKKPFKKINNLVYIGNYKGEVLKENQVIAPSKFKLKGEIIDIFEKVEDKNGKKRFKYITYSKLNGGKYTLKPGMISSELLTNFVFRTPTSSHSLGSSVEIVAFLPAAMGDLMITPSNFIPQMGQDFDVDKLTAYQYHYTKGRKGELRRLEEGDKQRAIERLYDLDAKQSNKVTEDLLLAMVGIFGQEEGERTVKEEELLNYITDRTVDIKERAARLGREFDVKLAENDIIEIHNKVFSTSNKEVRKKIEKVLSMDVAKGQASAIEGLAPIKHVVNLASPTYQMEKLISGSTGGSAIGIYAKGVTLNSLMQQLNNKITFKDENGTGLILGKFKETEFVLGRDNTLSVENATPMEIRLARSIAEVLDERVNTATDNEKAQVLGRVGITHIDAIAVDNLLSLLGVDLEITEIGPTEYESSNPFHMVKKIDGKDVYYSAYSIPYLLHSQPIIKEYFKRLKNGKSIIAETNYKIEEDIAEQLLGKDYVSEGEESKFTGENLVNNIKEGSYDNKMQREILNYYIGMIAKAKKVKELSQVTDFSSLGKSMFELKDKIEKFEDLKDPNGSFNDVFNNPLSLLGHMEGTEFVPDTNQGLMVETSLKLGEKLFFDYYPYMDEHLSAVMTEIEDIANFKGNSVKFRTKIFANVKKYLTASDRSGLFDVSAKEARNDLYFTREKEGHVSLSNYAASVFLKRVDTENLDDSKGEVGINLVKTNLFASLLSYTSETNGKPDLIKFDNTEAANINTESIYSSYRELFNSNERLPDRNGKPYTTRMFAQELAIYSYVGGGVVSEAIEFHKFIPIEYLKDTKNIIHTPAGTVQVSALQYFQGYDTRATSWTEVDLLGDFVTQFFQHNPKNALKFDSKVMVAGKGIMSIAEKLDTYPEFVYRDVNTKAKTLQERTVLYKHVGNGKYEQIDVLGHFGMSEYSYREGEATSNIPRIAPKAQKIGKTQPIVPPVKFEKGKTTPGFEIKTGDSVLSTLTKISSQSFQYNAGLSNMAKIALELFEHQVDTTKVVAVFDPSLPYRGKYEDGTITINTSEPNIAETFLHEFIHSVTKDYILKYTTDGVINSNAPDNVKELGKVLQNFKISLAKTYGKKYADFQEKYQRELRNRNLPKERQVEITFSETELKVFYPSINLEEFLSVTFSDNVQLLEAAKNLKYKSTGLNFLEKITKVWQRVINDIAGKENTIGIELVSSTLTFLESMKNEITPMKTGTTPLEEQETEEARLDKLKKIAPNSMVVPNGYGGIFSLKVTETNENESIPLIESLTKEDRDFINSLPLCI